MDRGRADIRLGEVRYGPRSRADIRLGSRRGLVGMDYERVDVALSLPKRQSQSSIYQMLCDWLLDKVKATSMGELILG